MIFCRASKKYHTYRRMPDSGLEAKPASRSTNCRQEATLWKETEEGTSDSQDRDDEIKASASGKQDETERQPRKKIVRNTSGARREKKAPAVKGRQNFVRIDRKVCI